MRLRESHLLFMALMSLTFCWLTLAQPRLLLNRSRSLPHRFFLCVKGQNLKRGDIVYFRNKSKLVPPHELTKVVAGLPGDKVSVRADKIWINNQVIGPLFEKTQRGEPLTPLRATVIPEGFVFLKGTHPFSLDSRYEEFGLVSVKDLRGVCRGWGRRS